MPHTLHLFDVQTLSSLHKVHLLSSLQISLVSIFIHSFIPFCRHFLLNSSSPLQHYCSFLACSHHLIPCCYLCTKVLSSFQKNLFILRIAFPLFSLLIPFLSSASRKKLQKHSDLWQLSHLNTRNPCSTGSFAILPITIFCSVNTPL